MYLGILFILLSLPSFAQEEGGGSTTEENNSEELSLEEFNSGGFGEGGFGSFSNFTPEEIKCPQTIEEWTQLRDKTISQGVQIFSFSNVTNKEGKSFEPFPEGNNTQGQGFGGIGGAFGGAPDPDIPKKAINFCLDDNKFEDKQKDQIYKCFENVPGMNVLVDPQDSQTYYEKNKSIFEASSTSSESGTPMITFKDPIMNDPNVYRGIDNPETRQATIDKLREDVKKIGGAVYYDRSSIGGGFGTGFGRVEVMIPGKDGCDRHYSIQTEPPGSNNPGINSNKNLPVVTVCKNDPFTGKKLDKPAGFLMFYERNFNQPGKEENNFGGMGSFTTVKEEGFYPSPSFGTQHSGATSCRTCHLTPFLPPVGDIESLPEADQEGYNAIKKRVNSEYPIQSWGMVRENDGQAYIDEFFSNSDRGAIYGPADSPIREKVLDHCLQGKQDIRAKIKKAMNCQSCHNGKDRELLYDEVQASMNTTFGTLTGATYNQWVVGSGLHKSHAMPPDVKLDDEERRILATCLSEEYQGAFDFSKNEMLFEGLAAMESKSVDCVLPVETEKNESDDCIDCDKKVEGLPTVEGDVLNIKNIHTDEGMVYVLEKDNSGADPDSNFGEMNLNIAELYEGDKLTGYKRPVFGGICTKFCSPSEFDVITDENGNFKEVKNSGMNGIQIYSEESGSRHKTLNETELKVLNEFIKDQLELAKKDNGLGIKKLIEDLGAEKLDESHKVDGLTGATYVEENNIKLQIPKELKGGFNTVVTTLLYAYDTQNEVNKLKKN